MFPPFYCFSIGKVMVAPNQPMFETLGTTARESQVEQAAAMNAIHYLGIVKHENHDLRTSEFLKKGGCDSRNSPLPRF